MERHVQSFEEELCLTLIHSMDFLVSSRNLPRSCIGLSISGERERERERERSLKVMRAEGFNSIKVIPTSIQLI